jgi:hypothetical protein
MITQPESLTLRDYFAAKAMTITEFHRCTYADGTRIRDDQAEWCYEVADAIIRARGSADSSWIDLTDDEAAECWSTSAIMTWHRIQNKLKEKNTGVINTGKMLPKNNWVTLTDEQIEGLAKKMGIKNLMYDEYRLLRAFEEVLRERNYESKN